MFRNLGILILLLTSKGMSAVPNEGPPIYGILPMRFFAGTRDAADGVLENLRAGLEARGAVFVSTPEIEDVLRANRIRQTDSISSEDAHVIRSATGIRFVMAGTLLDYAAAPEPGLALTLHLVDLKSGRRALSSLVSLRGDDFEGLLGLGKIVKDEALALEVAARIIEDFDAQGWPLVSSSTELESYLPGDALSSFVHPDFDPQQLTRIAVLPLVNRTNRREAGRVFGDVLAHQWFRSANVDVVESSELRAAFIRQKVRSLDFLDDEVLRLIGTDLGVRYFQLGSIDRYDAAAFVGGAYTPEVEASARLIDVLESRMVASATVRRRGDDYHVVLGLGTVNNLTSLADRTARELVALMGVKE